MGLQLLHWDDYLDLLFALPAMNIIVMTMSCYSGGLVKVLYQSRYQKKLEQFKRQGRTFAIIVSTSDKTQSGSVYINGSKQNPFPTQLD